MSETLKEPREGLQENEQNRSEQAEGRPQDLSPGEGDDRSAPDITVASAPDETTETTPEDSDQRSSVRQEALGPYLTRIAELLEQHQDPETDSEVTIGERTLAIASWERELTLQVLESPPGTDTGWAGRVAEAVALETKCLVDLDRLESATPETEPQVRIDLQVGAAIGLALKVELQKTVDLLVVSGEIDTAKQLSRLRNQLAHLIALVKTPLGPEALATAEELAEELLEIPSDVVMPELPKRKRRRRRPGSGADHEDAGRRSRFADANKQILVSRIRVMAITMLVLVVAWGVLILRPALNRQQLPELTIQDFEKLAAVQAVTARPPSLYLTISTSQWKTLDETARGRLVDSAAEIADHAGYSGALFRTADGQRIAQWLKAKGKTIYRLSAEGS